MPRRSKNKGSVRKRYRGGGFSTGPGMVSAGYLEIQPNRTSGGPDCLAAGRPGMLSGASYGGLPGVSGGSRRKKRMGGRYGFSLANSVLDASRGIVGGVPQAVRIPCESGAPNQLNLRMGGGGTFPVIDVGKAADAMVYHANTASYGNQMSVGGNTPLMIQVPYAAKSCIGGGRKTRARARARKSHKGKKSGKSHRRR